MPIFLNIFAAISLICSLIAFINLADGKSGVPRWTADDPAAVAIHDHAGDLLPRRVEDQEAAAAGVALLVIAAASMFASKVLETN